MLYSAGLAVAWTILGGFAGYASFGHAAFIGVGALRRRPGQGAHFPASRRPCCLVLGLAVGAVLRRAVGGDLLPILRLRAPSSHRMLGVSHVCARAQQQRRFLRGIARPQLSVSSRPRTSNGDSSLLAVSSWPASCAAHRLGRSGAAASAPAF